ncbi:MAG: CRTAC1 family protein [Armatimonadota bacterium]
MGLGFVPVIAISLLGGGCAPARRGPTSKAVLFRDIALGAGIDFRQDNGVRGAHRFIEVLPGGVGVLDFDGDGKRDLVFVQSGPAERDRSGFTESTLRLYRNLGGFRFEDATRSAGLAGDLGYAHGVAVADVDADGRSDLFLTSIGGNRLFLNRGGGRFTDVTRAWGLGDRHSTGYATSAVFGDIDHDGRPDLFVCHYAPWTWERDIPCRTGELPDYCPPDRYPPDTNQLFRNTGSGFVDITAKAGLGQAKGRSLVATIRDLDGDGHNDILVGTDLTGNQVWLGNGRGRFREAGSEMGLAVRADGQRMATMGIAARAIGQDGSESLFLTDFSGSPDALFRPIGNGVFEDVSATTGIAAPTVRRVSFGAGFLDFDNDGAVDLAIANGHVTEHADRIEPGGAFLQPQQLFRGTDGKFDPVSDSQVPDLAVPALGRGLVASDLDDDGRVDLVVVRQNATPLVLRNESRSRGHWIGFDLRGAAPGTDALHATVTIHTSGNARWTAVVEGGGSYLSASDRRIHFGLGTVPSVEKAEIRWSDGRRTVLPRPTVDRWNRVAAPPRHPEN